MCGVILGGYAYFIWRHLEVFVPNCVSKHLVWGAQRFLHGDRNSGLSFLIYFRAKLKPMKLGKKPLFRLNCFSDGEQLFGFSSRLCSHGLCFHRLLLIPRSTKCCSFYLQAQCQTRSWRCPITSWDPAEPPQPASTHSHLPAEV